MDIITSKVDISSSCMEYFAFGNGTVPFVMLPGIFTKPIATLAPAVAGAYSSFAEKFRVYVFDRPTQIPCGYTIDDAAGDTAAAFDKLGIKNACVFGVSMGGMIAQSLAVRRPDLVGKLILSSTASRITPPTAKMLGEITSLAQCGDTSALCLAFARAVYTPSFFEKYKEAITAALSGSTDEDIKRFVTLTEAINGFDIYDRLDKISCPVLVIGAGEDKLLGVQASRDIAEKTGGELYIYEGYGHAAYDEAPDYKDRIAAFFAG